MRSPTALLLPGAALVLASFAGSGCGGSDDEGPEQQPTDPSGAGGSPGSGGTAGATPSPGLSGDGWQSAYADGSATIGCDDTAAEMEGSGAARLTFGEAAVYVGYEQVGDNQNPIVARYDGDTQVFCEIHETEGPDGRAWGITWDGGDVAYVVYTVVGGGSSLEDAASGGWLNAYAPGAISGGGPRVSFVGRVDTTSGELTAGSFVIAVLSDGGVNSHNPTGPVTVLVDGNVEFVGSSAHKPIAPSGTESMTCTDYPFDTRYVLSPDLSTLVCAESTNCDPTELPCD